MWFGHIVPLFRFPVTDGTGSVSQLGREDRNLPLLTELCVGMNTETGTALYVTYGVNPDLRRKDLPPKEVRWGDDLAGWMVIAPFPPSLFAGEQLMRLDIHLKNMAGAFQGGFTDVVANAGGTLLGMEVLGTGDLGSLILLPSKADKEKLRDNVRTHESVLGLEHREWLKDSFEPSAKTAGTPESLGWISSLFLKENKIDWKPDRRVLVREKQITVPFGSFWFDFNQKFGDDFAERPGISANSYSSDYCLLARDMELPVLLALFPSRALFRIEMEVTASATSSDFGGTAGDSEKSAGSGMLNGIVRELASRRSNIWHVQNTYRSLEFDEDKKLRGLQSQVSIVASVPKERQFDQAEMIKAYLGELKRGLLRLRLPSGDTNKQGIIEALESAPEKISRQIGKSLKDYQEQLKQSRKDFDSPVDTEISQASMVKITRRVVDEHIQRTLKSIEPSFVKHVEIHGPPLFRCFFSHSARPAYDERDHIDRLKMLLESEVFEVIEGEFSLGMSTEALSRDKIRHCNLFVSFLWPREDFRKEKGEYMPPEWVIHEESFAIGQSIPVYRVREQDVMPPRYEKDRLEFLFSKGNMDTWRSLEHQFRLEVRQLVQQILLGIRPSMLGRDKEPGGSGE